MCSITTAMMMMTMRTTMMAEPAFIRKLRSHDLLLLVMMTKTTASATMIMKTMMADPVFCGQLRDHTGDDYDDHDDNAAAEEYDDD